jgi:solute carrier family 25 aspartate/glutamate transporter 12/13
VSCICALLRCCPAPSRVPPPSLAPPCRLLTFAVPLSPRSALATIKDLGLRGLYKGVAACWLRDVPFSIVFFPLFANLKIAFNGDNSLLGLFAAGAISGSISAGSVTPCDVVKTRLQVEGSTYKGIGDAFVRIVREEGYGALLKGLGPRMTVQAPLFGITLFAFDMQKKYILAQMEKEQAAKQGR